MQVTSKNETVYVVTFTLNQNERQMLQHALSDMAENFDCGQLQEESENLMLADEIFDLIDAVGNAF